MKQLVLSITKLLIFILGLGWSAHYYFITEIQGQINEKAAIIEKEKIKDVSHLHSRLDELSKNIHRVDAKTDRIIELIIKENRK
jgi:hypothetical protein